MANTRKTIVFNRITNKEVKLIPYNFDGDIVANEIICDELHVKGSIYVKKTISVHGDLSAEAIYSNMRICCYETLKVQDIYCYGPVIVGSNLIASGDIDCIGLDTASLNVLGNVSCKGNMRVDMLINVSGKLCTI